MKTKKIVLIILVVVLSLFLQPSHIFATSYGRRDYVIFSFGTESLNMKITHDANDSLYQIDTQKSFIEYLFGADIRNEVLLPHRFKLRPVKDFWIVGGLNHKVPFLIFGYSLWVNYSYWSAFFERFFIEIILFTLFILFFCFILIKQRNKRHTSSSPK